MYCTLSRDGLQALAAAAAVLNPLHWREITASEYKPPPPLYLQWKGRHYHNRYLFQALSLKVISKEFLIHFQDTITLITDIRRFLI